MEGGDFITFYHVTFQGNLKNTKTTCTFITAGDQTGITFKNTEENQGYLEDKVGRVFATTEWISVIRYINEIKERAERMGNESILKYLVVLRITFPLSDFNVLYSRRVSHEEVSRQHTLNERSYINSYGSQPTIDSYYFTPNYDPAISLNYLSIAVSRIYRLNSNRQGEYQFGKNWWWMTIADFDFQEGIYPVVPDAPFPKTTTTIDINQIVHDVVMREMLI